MKINPSASGGLLVGFILLGVACTEPQEQPPEGTWSCTSQWLGEHDGKQVISTSTQQSTCIDGVLTTTGLISIGEAQWTEKKAGTCDASGDELFGMWTVTETAAINEEAHVFETERLGGESLATASGNTPSPYRIKVLSRTDTHLKASDAEGKMIACTQVSVARHQR